VQIQIKPMQAQISRLRKRCELRRLVMPLRATAMRLGRFMRHVLRITCYKRRVCYRPHRSTLGPSTKELIGTMYRYMSQLIRTSRQRNPNLKKLKKRLKRMKRGMNHTWRHLNRRLKRTVGFVRYISAKFQRLGLNALLKPNH
jgi:hypothetical protein